ncbi:MAG: phenylalanine--tRNA ligase subunit beta [Patescibacteria group bacterium]|nr:phenylalanine--tRNA ligase subunit beta [Patescibacteria group bacterium]
MLVPLSWLKEYVDITFSPAQLGERLTEAGLGVEKIEKIDGDIIFDLEITPNRPDWLSIIGVAREIAAIEGKKIKLPRIKNDLEKNKPKNVLPLTIKTDYKINPRFTGIIIDGVRVKESPGWLKEKLLKMNQRPINNIVDITNFVMLEFGNPIHAFDYNKIEGNIMQVKQARGGEPFKSVDGFNYRLPKDAVVICDSKKIIDLCGIKGGYNSGTFDSTKTIFVRVPVENPVLIRHASQYLALRSEASSIFERGVNAGGTIEALKRCVDLILELAGGEIASKTYDLKDQEFNPWKVKLRPERLNKITGIEIKETEVLNILEKLNLKPKKSAEIITVTVPTYRNDLKIEEDIIEEVARLYGYNKFPKTLPFGEIQTTEIPYFKNYKTDEKVKNILTSCGFSEIYTYSLISERALEGMGINPDKALRIDNPVSLEYEYLRPTLKPNLIKALIQNKPNFDEINLFELGKVYSGKNIDEAKEEYYLSGISNKKNYYEIKGIVEAILDELGIPSGDEAGLTKNIEVVDEGIIFELNYSKLLEKTTNKKIFKPLPKYPPVMEDISLVINTEIKTADIISEIKKQSEIIKNVTLLDQFDDTRTFHIIYQDMQKNLSKEDTVKIREKILKTLKEKFDAEIRK